MSDNVVSFEYRKAKIENDRLMEFIETSICDKSFMKTNLRLLKYCLLDWYETEQKLANWK